MPPVDQERDLPDLHTEITQRNLHRLTLVWSILLPVHLAHVVIFWPYTQNPTTSTEIWRNGVLLIHGSAVLFDTSLLLLRFLLTRPKARPRTVARHLPGVSLVGYLLVGAALAIVDQHITTALTPLLIATLGSAVFNVVRPVVALPAYGITLLLFLVGAGRVQTDPDLLLTMRVNGFTLLSLGMALALFQWRNHLRLLRQQHRIRMQQRQLEAKNRELALLATRDPLTGLLNRYEFNRQAEGELGHRHASGMKAFLVMLDVDYFKRINDTYGHPTGDVVLTGVAQVLDRTLGGSAIIGRLGGEEFAVLLSVSSALEANRVAEQLRTEIGKASFTVRGAVIQVTISLGVAQLPDGVADGLARAYRAADDALYRAKHGGRNRVQMA